MVNRSCFFGKISEQMFHSVASWEDVDRQFHRLKDSKSTQKASKMTQSRKELAAKPDDLMSQEPSRWNKNILTSFPLTSTHTCSLSSSHKISIRCI